MKTLHISEISASEQFRAQAIRLAQTPAFRDIFADASVPRDPDWQDRKGGYTPQVFDNTEENRMAAAYVLLAAALYPVAVGSDIDGTASRFASSIVEAHLVPRYRENAMELASEPDCSFDWVTGRREHDARAIIGGPGLAAIANHGPIYIPANHGNAEELILNVHEAEFVQRQHAYASQLEKDLQIEINHTGVDVKDRSSPDGSRIARIFSEMKALCAGHDDFDAFREGEREASIRYLKYGKPDAIQDRIVAPLSVPAFLVFLGDSMGKSGTDRVAAEFVQAQGGAVIQVLNDRPRNSPEPGGLKPNVVLASPDMAAAYLGAMVSTRRAIKAGMRI
jgi:hypothetical protein